MPSGQKPISADVVARTYDSTIVVRRWLGAWIDFVALVIILLIPDYLLGNEFYQRTMFVWLAVLAAYFPVLETIFGKSIGKFITRTTVVNEKGGKPSWTQSIVRTAFRLLEVNPVLLGGIPAGISVLMSRNKQRLGDMVANTYVLKDKDAAELTTSVP